MKISLIILTLFVIGSLAKQTVPIPLEFGGFGLGASAPELHVEAFYDLLCPYSKSSWDLLEPLLRQDFNIKNNKRVRFTIHLFPLPYHTHAFSMAQGARVIADNLKNENDVFTYISLVFANQEEFSTRNAFTLSQKRVQQNLATLISKNMPDYARIFKDGLSYGNEQDEEARTEWKYGCSMRISATPTFLANGVKIEDAETFGANEWIDFLSGGYIDFISSE